LIATGVRSRLEKLFSSGALLRPMDAVPSSMALFRALASLCGYDPPEEEKPAGTDELRDAVGPAEHYVFVLVDGLGMNTMQLVPKDGFFHRHYERELRAVFPSTTASVLTSLATGLWPARHAIPGWNTYLPDRGFSVKPVLFRDRDTERHLSRLGVKPEEVYLQPSIVPSFDRKSRAYMPARIAGETYARYCRGDTAGRGYRNAADAADKILAHIRRRRGPGYTYFYYPDVDKVLHEKGSRDARVKAQIAEIDEVLLRLKERVPAGTRIVATADHGLIDVPREAYLTLASGDPLMEKLLVPPTGESRLPIFHLRNGADGRGVQKEFLRVAGEALGEHFLLLPSEALGELRLLGPGPLSPVIRGRLGDYMGIAPGPAVLEYVPPGKKPRYFKSFHGGLSADEMRVPLFLA